MARFLKPVSPMAVCPEPAQRRWSPGAIITPRVRLLEPLRAGGMAEIWIAEHRGLDTPVAVKLIAPHLLSNPIAVERFHSEARSAARVRSPHVVQHFDHGTTVDGIPFIVMELLEGESLRERLDREAQLGLARTCAIVGQVARALTAAHQAGVIHRDVKPENIFLTECAGEPLVKLLDFGVASDHGRTDKRLTRRGVLVGTPYYLCPEHVLGGKNRNRHADLWALAVVAYECITGTMPFDGEDLAEVCQAIVKASFAPPSTRCPEAGPALDAFFERAFAVDPARRFPSARALSAELARCRSQRAAPLRTLPAPTPPPSRRRRQAVVSVATVGALAALWWGLRDHVRASEGEAQLVSEATRLADAALMRAQRLRSFE